LLTNACKFQTTGYIQVFFDVKPKVSVREDALQITIRVLDQGIGIAADEIDSIFKLFWCSSTPESMNLNSNGKGLGLYICKQICQGLGGDIKVTSEQGHGTQFKFSLIGY